MAPTKFPSHRATHCSFILWGDKFEEEVATIFATELRRLGLNVKMVGLAGPRAAGVHGLVLSCDVTLGDALRLANQAICVILPCSVAKIKRIENDPRVHEFFKCAWENQAHFVVQHSEVVNYLTAQGFALSPTERAIYTEGQNLIHFAHEVAKTLAMSAVKL